MGTLKLNLQKLSVSWLNRCVNFEGSPCIQYFSIDAEVSFIVVLKEVIGKTMFFLNFRQKVHELSLNIANKRYVYNHLEL